MDELMQKITEKLNLTIDKAPEVYEMLKQQNIIYETCDTILIILAIASIFVEIFVITSLEILSNKKDATLMKVVYISIPLILIITLGIGLLIYRNTHAPDILFLRSVLN